MLTAYVGNFMKIDKSIGKKKLNQLKKARASKSSLLRSKKSEETFQEVSDKGKIKNIL